MAEPIEERDDQQQQQHPLIQRLPPDTDSTARPTPSFSLSPHHHHHGTSRTLNLRGLTSRKGATPPQSETPPILSPARGDVIDMTDSPSNSPPPLPLPLHSAGSLDNSMTSSPLPLWQRLTSTFHPQMGVASPSLTNKPAAAASSQAPPTSLLKPPSSKAPPPQPHGCPSTSSSRPQAVTPAATGQRPVLESDTDLTPMPNYTNMDTPHLKGECSRFGVRPLPKKKMIAKLTEIYDYTHPLTGSYIIPLT